MLVAIAVVVVLKKQRSELDLDHMQSEGCLNSYKLLLDIISPWPFTPFNDSYPTPFCDREMMTLCLVQVAYLLHFT